MSQAILQELARLKRANEALAERVTALEQPAPEPEIDPGFMPAVKRGPGRPRKEAAADGTKPDA